MNTRAAIRFGLALLLSAIAFCGSALAAGTPANVAGTWKVSVTGAAGNAKQTIVIQQDGNKITGTFKGPRQTATIEGTVDGNNIQFHVIGKIPLDYTGTVDGDSMKGTLTGKGKKGDWVAARGN
jgi:hypothetical protein